LLKIAVAPGMGQPNIPGPDPSGELRDYGKRVLKA
jgi:hypothetical protein